MKKFYNLGACIIFIFSNALALLYQLSYMWYSSLAVLVTVVVALLVSCLTGRLATLLLIG